MSLKIQELSFALQASVQEEHITGAEFSALLLEDSTGDAEVSIDGSSWFTMHKSKSIGFPGAKFTKFKVRSATAQTIKIQFGDFVAVSSQASVNATVNATIAPSDTLSAPGDGTAGALATILIAAGATRKEVEFCLPSTATNPVRIGPAGVTANSGSILEPGQSKVFGVDAAWYCIRTAAPDEIITVLSMEKP